MSFNCLACSRRKDVDRQREHKERCGVEKAHFKKIMSKGERSWSGNLGPYGNFKGDESSSSSSSSLSSTKMVRKRSKSIIGTFHIIYEDENYEEPRLVRSAGMRRDWSFENLKKRAKEMMDQTQEKQ